MTHPVETRERAIELVCAGFQLRDAGAEIGASRMSVLRWWRQGGRMELEFAHGGHGGLTEPVPAEVPGRGQVHRRALSSEERAVIAAGRRQGLSYVAIGELIGRDKSVVWREVQRNTCHDGHYRAPVAAPTETVQAHREPGVVPPDRGLDGSGLVTAADRAGARRRAS